MEFLQELLVKITNEHCTAGMKHLLSSYGVATISRLLKIVGLFCKRAL